MRSHGYKCNFLLLDNEAVKVTETTVKQLDRDGSCNSSN